MENAQGEKHPRWEQLSLICVSPSDSRHAQTTFFGRTRGFFVWWLWLNSVPDTATLLECQWEGVRWGSNTREAVFSPWHPVLLRSHVEASWVLGCCSPGLWYVSHWRGGHSTFRTHLSLPLVPFHSRTLDRCLLLQVFFFLLLFLLYLSRSLFFPMELCVFLSLSNIFWIKSKLKKKWVSQQIERLEACEAVENSPLVII